MKIVFCGTGKFSVSVLEKLIETNNDVVAICTQPDKVNARNGKIEFSPIKKYALQHSIKLLQFKSISKYGEDSINELQPDILISASFGQIFRKNILSVAKFGIVNVHASLLPKYRGPAPIQWALINNEKQTGITIMQTEEGIDCGVIYLQRQIDILDEDNSISLFEKLGDLGGNCLKEFLNNFDFYKKNALAQNENDMTYFPMLKKIDAKIDFNAKTQDIIGKIKGYALVPAFFEYKGNRFNVYNARLSNVNINGFAGTIVCATGKKGMHIMTEDGVLEITQIQPQNKKIMTGKECINGRYFTEGDRI